MLLPLRPPLGAWARRARGGLARFVLGRGGVAPVEHAVEVGAEREEVVQVPQHGVELAWVVELQPKTKPQLLRHHQRAVRRDPRREQPLLGAHRLLTQQHRVRLLYLELHRAPVEEQLAELAPTPRVVVAVDLQVDEQPVRHPIDRRAHVLAREELGDLLGAERLVHQAQRALDVGAERLGRGAVGLVRAEDNDAQRGARERLQRGACAQVLVAQQQLVQVGRVEQPGHALQLRDQLGARRARLAALDGREQPLWSGAAHMCGARFGEAEAELLWRAAIAERGQHARELGQRHLVRGRRLAAQRQWAGGRVLAQRRDEGEEGA
mmetsp:Transcript_6193/g.16180  ORF Transcript_6193/g.16180 Transcript_6193/m.16180 type:complete len:323 (-) Transcript_6193:754-1722(-)